MSEILPAACVDGLQWNDPNYYLPTPYCQNGNIRVALSEELLLKDTAGVIRFGRWHEKERRFYNRDTGRTIDVDVWAYAGFLHKKD